MVTSRSAALTGQQTSLQSRYFKDPEGPKEPEDKHLDRFSSGDHVQEISQPGSALSHDESVRYLGSQVRTIKTQFYRPFAKPGPAATLSPV